MSAEKIRKLNDAFRRTFTGGKVMMTAGIAALPDAVRAAVLNKVRTFEAFTADNDPHGEHDFGSFEVDGRKIFWKIDLYEEPGVKGTDGQPLTTRVLTIMLAEEW
jgi:hypothetical protein